MNMDKRHSNNAYKKAYERAVIELNKWYEEYKDNLDEAGLRERLWTNYRDKGLDPDGRFEKSMFDVICTADALISIYRICQMESCVENIVPVYERYCKAPIFYFPCEQGGVNQSRSRVFGDRIDFTLYDLSLFYNNGNTDGCRLKNTYEKPITRKWLEGIGTFKKLTDIYEIRGIFTDDEYRVINIETGEQILETPKFDSKLWDWSREFYDNLKCMIDKWYEKTGVKI